LWGIIKETGVDDAGLTDFHTKYFHYDTYRDENLAVYAAMGNRRIKLTTWNPITLFQGFRNMTKRLGDKKIPGNLAGEGLVQGGLLVFDSDGRLAYAYEEQIGSEIEMDVLLAATRALREGTTGGASSKDEL